MPSPGIGRQSLRSASDDGEVEEECCVPSMIPALPPSSMIPHAANGAISKNRVEMPRGTAGCARYFNAGTSLPPRVGHRLPESRWHVAQVEISKEATGKHVPRLKAAAQSVNAARGLLLDPACKRSYALDETVDPDAISQIDLDLPRTASDEVLVRSRKGRIRALLLRHVAEDPELGYCQGMSLVAAAFAAASRTQTEGFERFKAFISRTRGMWLPGFPLLAAALSQFALLVHRRAWFVHMQRQGVEPSMYMPQALMTLLTMWLPLATIVQCIGLVEEEGIAGLLAMCIVVLDSVGPRLQQTEDMEDILFFLQNIKEHAPQCATLNTEIRLVLPAAIAAVSSTTSGQDLPFTRISSEVIDGNGSSIWAAGSLSEALQWAIEETEAVGQKVLQWADEEASSIGSAILRWGMSGLAEDRAENPIRCGVHATAKPAPQRPRVHERTL